jgi:putative ATP-dependent endonuclease of the OLD family
MVSLQSFLIVLSFAEQRKAAGKNFILIAEEPELHLHPSLHRRLANRIRAVSTQSIVTTHSPLIAATYKPNESIFLRNIKGGLRAEMVKDEPVSSITSKAIRKLYVQRREAFYDSILGGGILVPEGDFDYDWLLLIQRMVETSEEPWSETTPLSIVPTVDAAIVETYKEVGRLRPDAIPFVDGDTTGDQYIDALCKLDSPPRRLIRLGTGAGIEVLAAWILEPQLQNPGPTLAQLLPSPTDRNVLVLQRSLFTKVNKQDRNLHENLVAETIHQVESVRRAREFLDDIGSIVSGHEPKDSRWNKQTRNRTDIYTAAHISRT